MTESPASETSKSALAKIAKNGLSVLGGNAAGEVLSTYALVLVAATLGKGGFGRLSAAQAFMEPFDVLAAFGLGAIVVKVAAEREGVDGALRGTMLGLRFLAAPIGVTLALVAALVSGRQNLIPVLAVLSVSTLLGPLNAWAMLPFEFYQTQHRRIGIPFLASVVRLLTVWLMIRVYPTDVGFQISALCASVATCLANVLLARRYYPDSISFDRTVAWHLLKIALPAAALEFVSMLYLRGSYLVLHEHGDTVLGEYAAADRLVKPVMMIGGVLLMSALPTISTLAQRRAFDTLRKAYATTVIRMLLGLAPVLGAVWFLAPWLLGRFAPQWVQAVWPLRILSFATVFMLLNSLSSVFIVALGALRVVSVIAVINLFIFFALARHWVPLYGASGAALSTMVMESINWVLQTSLVVWLMRRESSEARASRAPDEPGEPR